MSKEIVTVPDDGPLPSDEIRERIRAEWQAMRAEASQAKGWKVEDVVIDLVTLHRREVASAPWPALMSEAGRLVLEIGRLRVELVKMGRERDEVLRENKQLRNARSQ